MTHTEPETFDAIIIGTGQAGKPLAQALAEAGWSVAIVERGRVGGTCVVTGCTPTKTMVACARVAYLAGRAADFGVETGEVSVDLEAIRKKKRTIVDEWSEGNRKGLEDAESIELVRGEARFVDAHRIEVRPTREDGEANDEGGEAVEPPRILSAPKIFINTGTRTRMPGIRGLERVDSLDNGSLMELAKVPEHLVVIGGGFLGLEFAQMFRRFGARVTVLESGSRIAPREDDDISGALLEILRDDGIDIRLDQEITSVEPLEGPAGVRVRIGDDSVTGSHLLVATGRQPNTEALRTGAAGLRLSERGHIEVNDRLETNVEGIWALGDVNGGPPFTHVSYDDFRVVRENLLGSGRASREGRLVPYTLFTDPQLGRVGLSEREAAEKGIEVKVARQPMDRVARAMEMDETRGLMKALVDPDSDEILGAAVLGVEGGEIMSVLQMAMMGGVTATEIRDGVFAHPTLAESLNNLFSDLE